jgi:hypothetical protein
MNYLKKQEMACFQDVQWSKMEKLFRRCVKCTLKLEADEQGVSHICQARKLGRDARNKRLKSAPDHLGARRATKESAS